MPKYLDWAEHMGQMTCVHLENCSYMTFEKVSKTTWKETIVLSGTFGKGQTNHHQKSQLGTRMLPIGASSDNTADIAASSIISLVAVLFTSSAAISQFFFTLHLNPQISLFTFQKTLIGLVLFWLADDKSV